MTPLIEVQSTLLASIGYDRATRVFVVVPKASSFRFDFKEVPACVADALVEAARTGTLDGAYRTMLLNRFHYEAVEIADPAIA